VLVLFSDDFLFGARYTAASLGALTKDMHLTTFTNAASFPRLYGYHPRKIAVGVSRLPYVQEIELH
jgi:hypothetical protein